MEFATRAAIFIDNARRYNREHATALTLQRSLLPTGLSAPSSVDVRHRYLPGSKLIEVGGDWYESIALPGARVALVVGDVAGHGVRAAVTMGRLRTAIHTLATARAAARRDRCSSWTSSCTTLGEREPHFATCAYAIFDAVSGTCEVAVAGHLPPLLVRPDGSNEYLDVSPAPPLGVGEGPIQSRVVHRSRTAACSCSTPTAWSRTAPATSTTACSGCGRSSATAPPSARWRSCARPRWTACTPTSSATTSRCCWPGCPASRQTTTRPGRWAGSSPRWAGPATLIRRADGALGPGTT